MTDVSLLDLLNRQRDAMLGSLEVLVRHETPSAGKSALDLMARAFRPVSGNSTPRPS